MLDEAAVQLETASSHVGEYGTKRDLKLCHVSMIAIAGTISTGLFLGSGASLVRAGPIGFFLGDTIMGCLVGMTMTVYAPNIGGFIEMGNKYISPEAGFTTGINYILQTSLAIPTEVAAASLLISFWDSSASQCSVVVHIPLTLIHRS